MCGALRRCPCLLMRSVPRASQHTNSHKSKWQFRPSGVQENRGRQSPLQGLAKGGCQPGYISHPACHRCRLRVRRRPQGGDRERQHLLRDLHHARRRMVHVGFDEQAVIVPPLGSREGSMQKTCCSMCVILLFCFQCWFECWFGIVYSECPGCSA